MVIQLLVRSFVSAINIMVHALATVAAVSIARRAGLKPEV
jgi:fructose-specific phosphotransferase system IIC component